MSTISNRAPIDYDDIRRPYNNVRALASLGFIVIIGVRSIMVGEPMSLIILLPLTAIFFDALYRRATEGAGALPALVLDTTAIGVGLVYHGPDPGLYGLTMVLVLLIGAVMLPPVQAIGLALYLGALMALSVWLDSIGAPFAGVVLGSDASPVLYELFVVGWFVIVAASVMFLGMRLVLVQQDRAAAALAQERRAVELKNEFVSMVSHELRTPLTGIAGFNETLAESWTRLPTEDVDEFLTIIGRETDHLADLVEDILVIPRLEAGQLRLDFEQLDLAVEIHTVGGIVLDGSDFSVAIPSGVTVEADRTRLRQVLRNLLENARKYGGDEVVVDGERLESGMYVVSVSDNGPGVAKSDRERIFEHFEQLSTGDARAAQGVGLGLPIARKLCRAMGGDLWYAERFPTGATFRFSLRRSEFAPVEPHAVSPVPA